MELSTYGSNIHLFSPSGYDVYITTYDGMGAYPGVLYVKYGLRADDIQANGFLETTSEYLEGNVGGGAILMGNGYFLNSDSAGNRAYSSRL